MPKSIAIPLIIVSLFGGAALGWFLHPSASTAVEAKESGEKAKPRKGKHLLVDDVGQSASIDALRSRVKELERQLAEAQKQDDQETDGASAEGARNGGRHRGFGPPNGEEMRARMEELRQNDPERYAAMTNGMAKARDQRLRSAADRLDILASVDVSRLTKNELAVHERLQELIAREQELHDIARFDNPDTTDEMRRNAWDELRSMRQQKHDLERREREALLRQTAVSFGMRGKNAKELVDTVKAVYRATQSGGHGGGHPPPR